MAIETSIIIRTRNEEKWLGTVLQKIYSQTYKNFEVIIVDSGSSDKTREIAGQFPVKILSISYQGFSYPRALNFGVMHSAAGRFIGIMSAHSIPISQNWLADGLENFFLYPNAMGVYGPTWAMPNSSFWDQFFFNWPRYIKDFLNPQRRKIIKKGGMGVLGFTNAIIKKELWEKHNFNENYGAGGEDGEWSKYWFSRGYIAIKDKKFAVFHSHNLGLFGWYKQWQYWKSLWRPQPFHRLAFRKDRTHLD